MKLTFPALAGALAALACTAEGHPSGRALVDVTVEVDGVRAPLYPARDGSGRLYLEAREGAEYTLRLDNRTAERVGVVVLVDGLNVISAAREEPLSGRPGRMYVLGPWDGITVRGWRSSLDDVHRFTFEDERRSYAARVGKANRKMGWIEVAVHRDRERVAPPALDGQPRPYGSGAREEERPKRQDAPSAAGRDEAAEGYPGTGWGERVDDPVRLVRFEAEPHPAQVTTLRYEYAPALRALGLLPRRDRLAERDGGFAPPPPVNR